MKFTDAQNSAIKSREKKILVSASAGSGKTTIMIERIISLILDGNDLSDMAVCTFTKAAVADMKAKLYKKLTEISEGDNSDAQVAMAQLKKLPLAQISTLHSFCQQIIKTYFYVIEIDPDFEILSEGESSAILKRSIERVIDEYLKKQDFDFLIMYDILLSNRKATKLENMLEKLYLFAVTQDDFNGWLSGCLDSSNKHQEHISAIEESYNNEYKQIKLDAEQLRDKTIAAQFFRNYEACDSLVDSINLKEPAEKSSSKKLPTDDYLLELNDELKNLKKAYAEYLKKLTEAQESLSPDGALKYSKILIEMIREIEKKYRKEKNKIAAVDYSDLEHYAFDILKNEEAAKSINEKFKYVFVDEYQDINPLQESILNKLNQSGFFVGDVKQSIYAFRMCDPQIFVDKAADYLKNKNGEVILLNENFRSDNGVLQFCNNVFDDIMTLDLGRVDYKNTARLIPAAGLKSPSALSAQIVMGESESPKNREPKIYSVKNHEDEDVNDLIGAEINLVANRILDILSEEKIDGEPVKYGDIAVLLRSKGNYAYKLSEVLKELGVPVYSETEKSADECREIEILINILKLIDNSKDDIALVSSMRSCLGNFDDEELSAIRELHDNYIRASAARYKDLFFYESVDYAASLQVETNSKYAPLIIKTREFLQKIEHYSKLSYFLKASELAGNIVSDSEYFKYVLSLSGGDTKAKELAVFLDIMDSSTYNTSVRDFLQFINIDMPKIAINSSVDAVRIMTIHSSKGLEFPFVILADLTKNFNDDYKRAEMLLDSKLGLSLMFWDFEESISKPTSLHLRIMCEKRHKQLEEEMRLMYVALTRAKNNLSLIARMKSQKERVLPYKANCFYDFLNRAMSEIAEIKDLKDCYFESKPTQKRILYSRPNEKLVEKIKKYTEFIYPFSQNAVKMSVTKLAKSDEDEGEETKEEFISGALPDDRALDRGLAYHKIMEKINFFDEFDLEVARLTKDYPNEMSLVNLSNIKEAQFKLSKKIGARKFYRELPFIVSLPSEKSAEENILIQGIIDLIIIDDKWVEIVDYKTGAMQSKFMPSYKKQLQIYSAAAQKILNLPVSEKSLYSFSESEFVKVED